CISCMSTLLVLLSFLLYIIFACSLTLLCDVFFFFLYSHVPHRNLHSSLHDALPIFTVISRIRVSSGLLMLTIAAISSGSKSSSRSEEHTSELQSRFDLVCRLLLEKKKK